MNKTQYVKSQFKGEIEGMVRQMDSMRSDGENPVDVSLGEMVKARFNISMEQFYADLGIEPHRDTLNAIATLPDYGVRWLMPEIIRDALRLGLRKEPIWTKLVAAEETIGGLTAQMPHLNMSDATPAEVGEGETIPLGNLSYGQKDFKLRKYGRGLKLSYEVTNYVSLNVLAVWLQDFGVKTNHGVDTMAINTLINGEQTDGSESAPVVGTADGSSMVYRDLLKVWIRMARIGRTPGLMIGGENAALDTLDLDEFKKREAGTPLKNLDLKTPVPQNQPYYIHGSMPDDQQMIVDTSSALIKFNAQPLMVESDKIVSNQTSETYASFTTGFAIVYRDARIILDNSVTFASAGFPSYMDVDALEQVSFDK